MLHVLPYNGPDGSDGYNIKFEFPSLRQPTIFTPGAIRIYNTICLRRLDIVQ